MRSAMWTTKEIARRHPKASDNAFRLTPRDATRRLVVQRALRRTESTSCGSLVKRPSTPKNTKREPSRVVVAPRPQHLAQLRARLGLLNVEDDKLARLDASFAAAGLELVSRQELTFDIDLDAAATADLVGMGPNAFHDGARDFPRALTTTVAVAISSYESD